MTTVSRHLKWRARTIATNKVTQFENQGSTNPSALAYVARDLEVKFMQN
jgi:hypothetical protein